LSNLKNVAQMAGVSIMTVSRVVNDNGYVKDETREKVKKALKQLDYYPNNLGRSLNQNRVNIIAVMAPIIAPLESDPYYTRLLFGIETVLTEYSNDILLSTQRRRATQSRAEYDYFRPYLERKADGVILMGAILSPHDLKLLEERKIPTCVIGDRPESPFIDVVDTKNREAFLVILEKIYEKGHRKIAFGGYEEHNFNIQERFLAYKEFLKEKGLPYRANWVFKSPKMPEYRKMLFNAFRKLEDNPSVLAFSTDAYAIGFMMDAKEAGLQIPLSVSVSGFDGAPVGQFIEPSLTTMMQPLESMGQKAAKLILQRIEDPTRSNEIALFDVDLLMGNSLMDL
jgi:LacI family transcriptional regulator